MRRPLAAAVRAMDYSFTDRSRFRQTVAIRMPSALAEPMSRPS